MRWGGAWSAAGGGFRSGGALISAVPCGRVGFPLSYGSGNRADESLSFFFPFLFFSSFGSATSEQRGEPDEENALKISALL